MTTPTSFRGTNLEKKITKITKSVQKPLDKSKNLRYNIVYNQINGVNRMLVLVIVGLAWTASVVFLTISYIRKKSYGAFWRWIK